MHRIVLLSLAIALVAADTPADNASKQDLDKMQGDWSVVSMVSDGATIPDDDAQVLFRTVKGDQYTVSKFDKVIGKGSFHIDATKKPPTIDARPAASKGKPMLGIYEFDGDRYKVCFAPPGADRPTEFISKEGTKHVLTVWERLKK